MMKRFYDLSESGFDFAYYNNNIQFRLLKTGSDETITTNFTASESALRILGQMWWPDRVFVQVAPIDQLFPDEEARSDSLDLPEPADDLGQLVQRHIWQWVNTQIPFENQASWGLFEIESDIYGWNRLVLPADADLDAPLQIASADGVGPQKYTMLPAESLNGMRSVWLRLEQVSSESHLRLCVKSLNHLEISCVLGLGLLNNQYDTREPNTNIQGAPLREWRTVNQKILAQMLAQLREIGWQEQVVF